MTNRISFKDLYIKAIIDFKKEGSNSIRSGFKDLDIAIKGFQRGELTVLGARPGMGKTSFLISVMIDSILCGNKPMAFFSLEMSTSQLVKRIVLQNSQFLSFNFDKEERINSLNISKQISEGNVTMIDDCFSLEEIISKAETLIKENSIELVIIDYLQLIGKKNKSKLGEDSDFSMACQELKKVANKYNIVILISSQLRLDIETRKGSKKPKLSDINKFGSISSIAGNVLFLYRPEYYIRYDDEKGVSLKEEAEIIISQSTTGYEGTIKLKYDSEYAVFKDSNE